MSEKKKKKKTRAKENVRPSVPQRAPLRSQAIPDSPLDAGEGGDSRRARSFADGTANDEISVDVDDDADDDVDVGVGTSSTFPRRCLCLVVVRRPCLLLLLLPR